MMLSLAYATYAAVHWEIQGYVAWEYLLGSITSALLWVPLTLLLQAMRHPRSHSERL
jgi:hypothetical protein